MNKRDVVLNLLDANKPQPYIPAGFFIHFDPGYHFGQAAVDKHLEYFRYTDMDLVKIRSRAKVTRITHVVVTGATVLSSSEVACESV
jgi:uroporphyrinogen decarboxylase